MVKEISIFGEKTSEERELDAIRGEKVADRAADDPRFALVPADPERGVEASNAGGSFEALMSGWGGSGGRPAFAPLEGEGG
jgi:hypothetical protein